MRTSILKAWSIFRRFFSLAINFSTLLQKDLDAPRMIFSNLVSVPLYTQIPLKPRVTRNTPSAIEKLKKISYSL